MANDRVELICDLAETYNILDYSRVPVSLLGTLVSGLGPNSRLGSKEMGITVPMDTIWLVKIYDALAAFMADKNHPHEPVARQFIIERPKPEKERKFKSFSSVEEYEEARAKILNNAR